MSNYFLSQNHISPDKTRRKKYDLIWTNKNILYVDQTHIWAILKKMAVFCDIPSTQEAEFKIDKLMLFWS